ncbi:MAG: VOC family protein [Acidimicrobiales bacterium]
MAKLTELVPMLATNDLRETIDFYQSLGFECLNSLEVEGQLVWAFMSRDAVQVMFTWDPPHTHDDGDTHSHGPALAGSLYFYPDDVDALWAELKDKAKVLQEIGDRDYGMRDFSLEDPNGYMISFGGHIPAD